LETQLQLEAAGEDPTRVGTPAQAPEELQRLVALEEVELEREVNSAVLMSQSGPPELLDKELRAVMETPVPGSEEAVVVHQQRD
jgi:hypothetical protein